MAKALDFIGFRLNGIKDADIINAIAPYKNASERARELIRKGIATEASGITIKDTSPEASKALQDQMKKPGALRWASFPDNKPKDAGAVKSNLTNNFD